MRSINEKSFVVKLRGFAMKFHKAKTLEKSNINNNCCFEISTFINWKFLYKWRNLNKASKKII